MRKLFLTGMVALLITGCSRLTPVDVDALAKCIQTQSSAAQKEQFGAIADRHEAGATTSLRRFDQLGCRGALGIFDNDATRTAQGHAVSKLLADSRPFRRGAQVSTWKAAGFPNDVSEMLAGLVMLSADDTLSRAWGQACKVLDEDIAAKLRDHEAPYLTAYAGTRGWVSDIKAAKTLAAAVSDEAKGQALVDARVVSMDCANSPMQQRLRAHIQAMDAFDSGTNKFVLGCRVVDDKGELVLRCS